MSDEDVEAKALALANHDDEGKQDQEVEQRRLQELFAALPDGVFIARLKDEKGNLGVDVLPTGSVELDQVSTLLEIGYAEFRAKIGLPGR